MRVFLLTLKGRLTLKVLYSVSVCDTKAVVDYLKQKKYAYAK